MGPGIRRDERKREGWSGLAQPANLPFVTAPFLILGARRRDPDVDAWLDATDPIRHLVSPWFERLRALGPDIREILHDGAPTACVGNAAFAYVNAFTAHAAIGFFHGAELSDPHRLLEGTGKRMRHLKLRPSHPVEEAAIAALIDAAYADIRARL